MKNSKNYIAWVEIDVYLLLENQGGRKGWVSYGYRPSLCFDDSCYESVWSMYEIVKIYPGDKTKTRAYLTNRTSPVQWELLKDKEFTIQEGPKIVGKGKITGVVEADIY